MKRTLKTILHSILLLGSIEAIIIGGIFPLSIVLVPVGVVSAAKLADDLRGNEINNSIFFCIKKWKYSSKYISKTT